jgi:pheromone shutdown protein TraB
MLEDITGEYPSLSNVLVNERDTYLTYSLQLASLPLRDVRRRDVAIPVKVVGVVGIGHVPGIVRNWGRVTDSHVAPLDTVPEASWANVIFFNGVKYSVKGLLILAAYRYLVPTAVKTACRSSLTMAWDSVLSAVKPKQS